MKRLFVIVGEASGDAHATGVLTALRARWPDLGIRGLGGPKLQALAGDGVENWIEEAAVIGLWEVLRHYPYFRRKFHEQLVRIQSWQPDAVLLVDYPGFNLRLARALHTLLPQLPVLYYISPQVWAWHRSRIPKMARWLRLMICIFPFEVELYNASGLTARFGGHPITDQLAPLKTGQLREPGLIALLPGSRRREIARLFPLMLAAAQQLHTRHPEWRFEAAAASEKLEAVMRAQAAAFPHLPLQIRVRTAHDLMQRAAAGWVASGTATLEAAFFGLPHALVYKVSWLTYAVGRAVIQVPYLGIANILAGREIVRELLQHEATPHALAAEVERLISDTAVREAQQQALAEVIAGLGEGGAYQRAADLIAEAIIPSP